MAGITDPKLKWLLGEDREAGRVEETRRMLLQMGVQQQDQTVSLELNQEECIRMPVVVYGDNRWEMEHRALMIAKEWAEAPAGVGSSEATLAELRVRPDYIVQDATSVQLAGAATTRSVARWCATITIEVIDRDPDDL